MPIPPYAEYNIDSGQPENLLDFVNILQEELVRAGVLPADFDFEAQKKQVAEWLEDTVLKALDGYCKYIKVDEKMQQELADIASQERFIKINYT